MYMYFGSTIASYSIDSNMVNFRYMQFFFIFIFVYFSFLLNEAKTNERV